MAGYKTPDFNERAAAARAAKQEALDQLRNKPAPDPALVAERQAVRAARESAAQERDAARQLKLKEAKAAKLVKKTVDPETTEAELKAARDAKYAARKARKR